ncbi:MAG TPA: ABC transporter ATP-binding protein [Planctomycetota bacterium]|nr:ABC transporter ATP-binding protein [Planctomycetota bacterium]
MTDAPARKLNVWALTARFLALGKPYLVRIFVTIGVTLIASGAKALQAFILAPLIDNARQAAGAGPSAAVASRAPTWLGQFAHPSTWEARMIVTLALVTSALMCTFGWLKDYLTNYLTARVLADLRNRIARHLPFLPLRYHYDRKSGDLLSRITNDVALTESAANFYYDDMIVQPITILCALVLIFVANWKLALMASAFFLVYTLFLSRLGRALRKARKKSLEHLGDMTGTMIQTFSGIKVVKAFNMENAQADEFMAHNESYFKRFMRAIARKAMSENTSQVFVGIAVTIMLVGGYDMLKRGQMTPGQMAALGMAVAIINGAVREAAKSYNRLLEASAGCERVFELLDQPRETEHETGRDLPAEGEGVEYRNVSFAYGDTPVLRDISFQARPGEIVAVVGKTGSGKTTLLDLLCRFYDPQDGAIIVNGVDLRGVKRSSLLSRIAVVTQDPFLFNTSIGENIRYARRDATDEQVVAAAKAAHIHEFIETLPQKYATPAGERGAKLSGGQRQRVTIARAILRDPSILILDEATSSLDAESEKAVQAALNNLIHSAKRITFVIAHRLSTIRNADRILVLDGGRVVQDGKHGELVGKPGIYSGLYETQFSAD